MSDEQKKPRRRKAPEPYTHTIRFDSDAIFRVFGITPEISVGVDRTAFREAVENQLAALGIRPETGPEEMPGPDAELMDTYAVAFAEAIRECEHENSTSTRFASHERQCDDCGRYFTRKPWWDR